MKPTPPPGPHWLVARLGDDGNWWAHQTSDELGRESAPRGVLDPRQIAALATRLEPCFAYGLDRTTVSRAFVAYQVAAETGEQEARLQIARQDWLSGGNELFALAAEDDAGEGPYAAFISALAAARIRQLNATHRYSQPCTEWEMLEELEALDNDRYFSSEHLHPHDEITELLDWAPAE